MAARALETERLWRLTEHLMSAEVQIPASVEVEDVPARLDRAEVEKVIRDHVPGVDNFLFRGQQGKFSLLFMLSAYEEGLRAFQGTPLQGHLTSLLRIIVHHGHAGGAGAAEHLREVAEAFTGCQAVQARSIERVGLRLHGSAPDFQGQVMRLVSEYKTLAIKMLAIDRLAHGLAKDYDAIPTHYENRLTADLGRHLGLDADFVELAGLDGHASSRFQCILGEDANAAACRCREFFDIGALLQAFVAEVNNLNEQSPQESLPVLFLSWVSDHFSDKHVVLDEVTCSRPEIDVALAIAIFEALFLGAPAAPCSEEFRGILICDLFPQVASNPSKSDESRGKPVGEPGRTLAYAHADSPHAESVVSVC